MFKVSLITVMQTDLGPLSLCILLLLYITFDGDAYNLSGKTSPGEFFKQYMTTRLIYCENKTILFTSIEWQSGPPYSTY